MRSRHLLALLSGFILTGPPIAAAQLAPPTPKQAPETRAPLSDLVPLTGPALDKAFRGKTMDGIYKTPRQRSGTHKFTESFNTDGSADYFEGPLVDKGQWRVRGKLICFRYDGALAGGVSCFTVYKSASCLYSYDPANLGVDGYPLRENLWSVKTALRGDLESCSDLLS